MQYTASVPFRGDPDRAFQLAEKTLTTLGFRFTQQSNATMELAGPGMRSSRQHGLVGASHIRIADARGELILEADLGGAEWLSRFVTLFPVGLCAGLAVVLSAVFYAMHGPGNWINAVAVSTGGCAVIWMWLGPLMARGIRARTNRALDALLVNMAAVGESP
jgi:hypothetical protein